MRTRERVTDSKTVDTMIYYYRQQESCTDENIEEELTNDGYVSSETHESMEDVVTPGFKRLSSEGGIINNPMKKITTITRDNRCLFQRNFGWSGYSCDPQRWLPRIDNTVQRIPSTTFASMDLPTLPLDSPTNAIQTAVSRAWANIGIEDIQAMVGIGESKKTVVSMMLILRRLISILRKIKRLDVKGLRHELTAKQLADRYMELRYAIRPLIYDAVGVVQAISNQSAEWHKRLTFRGFKTYQNSDHSEWIENRTFSVNNSGTYTFDAHMHTEWSREVQVRAGVLTQMEELSKLNIWGITQPVESLWELVPFSFVVDRILNIGQTIASWMPNYGLQTLSSWYTITTSVYRKVSQDMFDPTFVTSGIPNTRMDEWTIHLDKCFADELVVTKERCPEPERNVIPNFTVKLDTFFLIDLLIIARKIIFHDHSGMSMISRG